MRQIAVEAGPAVRRRAPWSRWWRPYQLTGPRSAQTGLLEDRVSSGRRCCSTRRLGPTATLMSLHSALVVSPVAGCGDVPDRAVPAAASAALAKSSGVRRRDRVLVVDPVDELPGARSSGRRPRRGRGGASSRWTAGPSWSGQYTTTSPGSAWSRNDLPRPRRPACGWSHVAHAADEPERHDEREHPDADARIAEAS